MTLALSLAGMAAGIPLALYLVLAAKLVRGRRQVAAMEYRETWQQVEGLGEVSSLTLLPLSEIFAASDNLEVEPGVSYLVEADDSTILMDVGFNRDRKHPSPLLHNARQLGVDFSTLDMIFFSHLHLDHVGGMKEAQSRTFSISQGPVQIPPVPIMAPEPVTGSDHNPTETARVLQGPEKLAPGVASGGTVPRHLFIQGRTLEQSLVVNLKGKGLVVLVGCGHQTIEQILDDINNYFQQPVYAVAGGLHYPVHGGRVMLGPLNLQSLAGSDRLPGKSITEDDVEHAIEAMKHHGVVKVALSGHDTSDWALDRFAREWGDNFIQLKVGEKLTF